MIYLIIGKNKTTQKQHINLNHSLHKALQAIIQIPENRMNLSLNLRWITLCIFLVASLSVSADLFGQDISNLKALNGFREFKYGDGSEKFNKKYFLDGELTNRNSKNTEYFVSNIANNDKSFKTFGIEFDGLKLYFTNNKLYQIILTKMYSYDEMIEQRETAKIIGGKTSLEKVVGELSSLFGNEVNNDLDNERHVQITTFKHPSIDNECELRIEFNEALRTVFMNLTFHNKPLKKIAQLNKYN